MSVTGSCHCGAVKFEMREPTDFAVNCNCSLCRRLGSIWIYSKIGNVTITGDEGATIRYTHGDETLAVHSCKKCGCTTHWEGLNPEEDDRMAVNIRMSDPDVMENYHIRRFDGADTWKFLD